MMSKGFHLDEAEKSATPKDQLANLQAELLGFQDLSAIFLALCLTFSDVATHSRHLSSLVEAVHGDVSALSPGGVRVGAPAGSPRRSVPSPEIAEPSPVPGTSCFGSRFPDRSSRFPGFFKKADQAIDAIDVFSPQSVSGTWGRLRKLLTKGGIS